MKKLLAACTVLMLATPAWARGPDTSSSQPSSEKLAGQALLDKHDMKIGHVEYMTTINDKKAAVVIVDGSAGTNEIALPVGDLHPTDKGVTVAMSENELATYPTYAPGQPYNLTAVVR